MRSGKVFLVGAGPGNAGLITVRGKQLLEAADAVLYDRLVGDDILAMIHESAVKIDVGKSPGRHLIPQQEINKLLLEFAKNGKNVVRLKGGDPYLFGRGAEELSAIAAESIPFEVVPGVSSAIAVPAYAGIPVSHREFSSSLHIITAHRKNKADPELDYLILTKLGGTLIFLMGVSSIEKITGGLLGVGMPAHTPAAIIENGTRPNQRKVISTLGDISDRANAEGFCPPSVLLVGEVCSLSSQFDWFSQLPLKGVNIIVTRQPTDADLSNKLREMGANVKDFPCIRTKPLPISDSFFDCLKDFGWIIFTSPVGAEIFFSSLLRVRDIRLLHGIKFAAVGAKTAEAAAKFGIIADYVPDVYNSEALAAGLPQEEGIKKRVLLFRAKDGAPELIPSLRLRGFSVTDTAAYETIRENCCPDEIKEMMINAAADFVIFTSASAVNGFVSSIHGVSFPEITAVCIGGKTAGEAKKCFANVVAGKQATTDSMIECILEFNKEKFT